MHGTQRLDSCSYSSLTGWMRACPGHCTPVRIELAGAVTLGEAKDKTSPHLHSLAIDIKRSLSVMWLVLGPGLSPGDTSQLAF
jgi:hypothetical protein